MTLPMKIDVHHHLIPPELQGHVEGLKGMKAPEWSLPADETFCKSISVRARILSVTSPGVNYVERPRDAATIARSMNQYSAKLRDNDPASIGFFATIPPLSDTDLALEEIRYSLDKLHADGVTLFTSYGKNKYLGNDLFVPIWRELNRRKAVVFVHPIDNGRDAVLFNDGLPAPTFDWAHETGRTAIDFILNGRMNQFPDLKIILSHSGGTLPLLARRATLASSPGFGAHMSGQEIYECARNFYFDSALSGSDEVWPLILRFAKKGHLLFGSDYPHATEKFSRMFTEFIDDFNIEDERREDIYYKAAEGLFPRLKRGQ